MGSYLGLSENFSLNTEGAEVKLTEEAGEPLSLQAGEISAAVKEEELLVDGTTDRSCVSN